jgi:hypothetical protein
MWGRLVGSGARMRRSTILSGFLGVFARYLKKRVCTQCEDRHGQETKHQQMNETRPWELAPVGADVGGEPRNKSRD